MKVKTRYVPLGVDYITVGKVYDVEYVVGSYWIIDDENDETLIELENDEYNIGGKSWEIVE